VSGVSVDETRGAVLSVSITQAHDGLAGAADEARGLDAVNLARYHERDDPVFLELIFLHDLIFDSRRKKKKCKKIKKRLTLSTTSDIITPVESESDRFAPP
jgi:hypothetical protein